ncbi:PadR family transcriptional regulator [Sphaerisporangium corydalis]|uniref:PadR family transcriptional regulator n=1 Tax=Sphaerisporangium corydalis TaxID=1441875 RepID=A0ABV9EEL3_9ACTN|nr:PadR family transcriptional regulator [Sphaerisporangium corydalis]
MTGSYFLDDIDREVLAVLERGPLYGYLIMEALRLRLGVEFHLPTGGLFPVLRRLERLGYIRSAWVTVENRERRTYELTEVGHQARSL